MLVRGGLFILLVVGAGLAENQPCPSEIPADVEGVHWTNPGKRSVPASGSIGRMRRPGG